MKKKLFAILLAAAVLAGLSVPALAADDAQTIEVSYSLGDSDQSYNFTIPSTLPVSTSALSSAAEFDFHDVNIVSSMSLTMTVSSANGWKLVNSEEDVLSYDLYRTSADGAEVLADNGVVLSINGAGIGADAGVTASCYAIITDGLDSISHLGGFSDTLTFTITVSENTAAVTETTGGEQNVITENNEDGQQPEETSGGTSGSGSGSQVIGQAGAAGQAAAGGGQELGPQGEYPRPTPDYPDPEPEPDPPHPNPYQWQSY